ncbi:SIMPL domain-containing protein [uncultured Flavobacterium sp.]|uniref:SIMPL domain-containing protein n=1 Tax=uncultured Flavobacterium sp. TaxID=165435 RepID=UPI0030ED9037|tara:strand:+ start:40875 stop:41567 length:693 start_codon:yes stop_codon:yes gene_type:complete
MKKIILLLVMTTSTLFAQEIKQVPQISVSGEGKIKVVPDEAMVTVSIENTSKEAAEAKKANDIVADKVLKLIKSKGIDVKDFQTQRMNLYQNYDYNTKKKSYVANQTIAIHLKDLSKYDNLMIELVDTGINGIQGVEFMSSKIKELEKQARKNALLDAKSKAEDYVSVLVGQKLGKVLLISDNSQTNYPQPVYRGAMKAMAMESDAFSRETLAVGEIEIISTVSATFVLE